MWGAAGSCEEKGGALARSMYGTCVVHDISRHSIVDLEDVLSISAAFYQRSDGFSYVRLFVQTPTQLRSGARLSGFSGSSRSQAQSIRCPYILYNGCRSLKGFILSFKSEFNSLTSRETIPQPEMLAQHPRVSTVRNQKLPSSVLFDIPLTSLTRVQDSLQGINPEYVGCTPLLLPCITAALFDNSCFLGFSGS
jgi:hypothetical protein